MTDAIEAARRIETARASMANGKPWYIAENDAFTVARALLAIAEPMQDMRERAQHVHADMGRCDSYDESLDVLTAALTTAHAEGRAEQRLADVIRVRQWCEEHGWPDNIAAAIEGGKP